MTAGPIRAGFIACLALAAPASAAERTLGVGSFDRVRIEGDFDVRIAPGSPRATLSGDRAAIESVDLRADGTTLSVRRKGGGRDAGPVTVTLATPKLRAISVVGAARVAAAGMTSSQAELSVGGTGAIAVDGVAAELAAATLIGDGRIRVAGRARMLRLSTLGAGTIDASKLVADELALRLDGAGETLAQARYVATVSASGAGRVVVTGKPKCTARGPSADKVKCGAP